MKTLLCVLTALFMGMGSLYAQSLKPIKLNAPNKDRGSAIMKALADRSPTRSSAYRIFPTFFGQRMASIARMGKEPRPLP